jgi:anti-sigma B factor antagonist
MPAILRKFGDAVIIDLDGRLTLGGPVDDFRARWTEAVATGTKTIVVNLARVTMIDSSGIGTMIRFHSAMGAVSGKLMIVGANQTVREAFRVTRLDKVFQFHENESIALGLSAGVGN